jgi:hypothetical protein
MGGDPLHNRRSRDSQQTIDELRKGPVFLCRPRHTGLHGATIDPEHLIRALESPAPRRWNRHRILPQSI